MGPHREITPDESAAELRKIINVTPLPPDGGPPVLTCQWIFGDAKPAPDYCGDRVFKPGEPYCAYHTRIARIQQEGLAS